MMVRPSISRSRSRTPPVGPTQKEHQSPPSQDQSKDADVEKGSGEKLKLETRILSRFPLFISRFLGYRPPDRELAPVLPVHLLGPILEAWLWAWIGSFLSLSCIAVIFTHADPFAMHAGEPPKTWTTPVIIGSYGASSLILFGEPNSALGQPYVFFGGQVVSAVTGVIVAKLFAMNPRFDLNTTDQSTNIVWVAGACAAATASLIMIITE
jgi:HPP family